MVELDSNLAISLVTLALTVTAIAYIPISIIGILKTLNFKDK